MVLWPLRRKRKEEEDEGTYMGHSLWLNLESFDELESVNSEELWRDREDPDIICYAGDGLFAEALYIKEEVAVRIFANYKQVRTFIHKK